MNQIYHKVRNHTLTQKTNWVQSLFTGHKGQLLDVGAGTGAFAHSMLNKGWKVTALEPDAASRQKAQENYNINLLPIEELFQLEPAKYEVITLWHVLEHVENLEEYISTLEKLLTKNGTLIIAVPNYKSYDANYYSKFWAAFDVPRHLWHFSETSISKLFAPVNLKVEKTLPMKFDAYYVSLLSEKYKCGSMKPISALYRGFVSNIKAIKSKQYSSLIYVLKKS